MHNYIYSLGSINDFKIKFLYLHELKVIKKPEGNLWGY